jgi:hypothetical protein
MRLAILALALLLSPITGGCAQDRTVDCVQAYDHLINLAKRRMQPRKRLLFVQRCRSAWDDKRHACLMASTTPQEALKCRVERVRPG